MPISVVMAECPCVPQITLEKGIEGMHRQPMETQSSTTSNGNDTLHIGSLFHSALITYTYMLLLFYESTIGSIGS